MLLKKFALLSLVYTFLCFVGIVVFSSVTTNIPAVLEIDVFSYRLLIGLSAFFKWLPSIIVSVFFVVLAIYLDKDGDKSITRFSSYQMKNYQRVMIVTCVNVIVLFCATEIFQPMIKNALVERETRHADYEWYIAQSQEAHKNDDIFSALYFIDMALEINPSVQEALALKELYERTPAENTAEILEYFPEYEIIDPVDELSTSLTVLSMLQNAKEAFNDQRYFDAHYYAFVGLELGGENNPNSQELQMISLDAWNILQTWSGFVTDEDMRLFNLKRSGYSALMEGDALSAYYIFLDLYKALPYDPDVMRYSELSKNALLNEYFFIDETSGLGHFEKAKNVSFTVERQDGLFYDIHIAGITNVRSAGNILKYLRNYSCSVRNKDNTMLYSFTVPYVKLIGQPLESFNEETIAKLNLVPGDLVPRLLLTSVDRDTRGVVSAPVFSHGSVTAIDDSLTLLPMSLEDFDLILDASVGPQYINLAALLSFIPKAEQFGFSELVYSSFFLYRVSYAFFLIAIFLFLAIQAWNFRLKDGSIFRFYWVLIIPIFTLLVEGVRVLLEYGMSLTTLALARIEGFWQIPTTIIVFLVLIIIFSIRFLSLHANEKHT